MHGGRAEAANELFAPRNHQLVSMSVLAKSRLQSTVSSIVGDAAAELTTLTLVRAGERVEAGDGRGEHEERLLFALRRRRRSSQLNRQCDLKCAHEPSS